MNAFRTSRGFRLALGLAVALAAAPFARDAPAQGSIRTLDLNSGIDPAAAGALDPGAAYLPRDLWDGTDRAEATRLVAALPARIASPVLADIARRVTAIAAPPPAGPIVAPSFSQTRAEALLRMGRTALAAKLIASVPRAERGEADDLLLMHAELLTQDRSAACAVARSRGASAQNLDFPKVNAFCEATSGDRARSELAAAMLAERSDDDIAFFDLLSMANGVTSAPTTAIKKLKQPSPVHLAMMRAVGAAPDTLPPPDAPLAVAIENMVAVDPAAPLPLRREAAWRAVKANAADIEAARQLFLAAGGGGTDGSGRIAGLLADAAAQTGQGRAVALARLLDAGAEAGAAGATAELARPMLTGLLVVASGPDIAARIGRGLLLAAEPSAANRWLTSLEAAQAVPGAPDAAARLRQLVALGLGRDPRPFGEADAVFWLGAIEREDPALAGRRANLLANLREAMDLPLPLALANAPGVTEAERPGATRLMAAANAQKVGETALRAVLHVETQPATGIDRAELLAEAARALALAGLKGDALLLAAEAGVAGGL